MLSLPYTTLAILPILNNLLPALAQGGGITCNSSSICPSSVPCCSEFGFCGKGSSFCLGGCNPLWSHTPTSCEPAPLCQSAHHTFPDNSRILTNSTYYNGNASEYDWVVDKGNIMNTNSSGGELVLMLTKENGGTRLSSTRYVHYGTITARLQTGRWAGVVTAFITMSDSKDEIDWEWPGNKTTEAQTNHYFLGIPNYNNGQTVGNLSDTYSNYHNYTIDWQPDVLRFLIDNEEVRRVEKSDVQQKFPRTPSRVEISIWPAGLNTSASGTVTWAGGYINFNDPDYIRAGHFYAIIQSVSINCSDPSGSVPPDGRSYVYGSNITADGMLVPSVAVTNQTTVINGTPARFAGMTMWTLAALVLSVSTLLF